MTFEQAQEKALQYAKEHGYSTIRRAGERDGYWYFHFFNKYSHRMFLGLPHYVKVSQSSNDLVYVEDFHETMWATEQEVELNNL